jgi:hypothetical protein
MDSPAMAPFLAKASRDQAALAGFSCGEGQVLVDAHTGPDENATAAIALAGNGASKPVQSATIIFEKADPNRYLNGIRVRSMGANLKLTVDLNSSNDNGPTGKMILCRSGLAATLGHAEFELPPGQPFVADFLATTPSTTAAAAGLFDIQGADSTLPVDSVTVGRLEKDGNFTADRIACGTTRGGILWRKLLSSVGNGDCAPASMSVTGLDLASGKVAVSDSTAFFSNFQADKDSAHFVSRATRNPIVQYLLGAIVAGTIIPWALAQFKKAKAKRESRDR